MVDAIDIPDLSEFVSRRRVLEQAFDTVIDGIEQGTQEIADLLDRFLDLLVDFIAGILYVILTILTGLFLFAMSAQFSGSFLSIFWLVSAFEALLYLTAAICVTFMNFVIVKRKLESSVIKLIH